MRPHRRQPTRLPRPWDSPGKNTGVGCHFLVQCMKVKRESEVTQSCPTLCESMDCSLPGSSVHGILQATVLEWGASACSYGLCIDHCNKLNNVPPKDVHNLIPRACDYVDRRVGVRQRRCEDRNRGASDAPRPGGTVFPWSLQKEHSALTSDFQPPHCERINWCTFKPLHLWYFATGVVGN